MTAFADTSAQSYLILLQPELVARDIAFTIKDFDPDADIIMARNAAAALIAVEAVSSIAVAFLAIDPEVYAASDLANAIRVRHGRTVLLGDAAETAGRGPGWTALIRPFTTDCVTAILEGRTAPALPPGEIA